MEPLRSQSVAKAVPLPAGALSLIGLGVLGLLVAFRVLPVTSLNVPISVVLAAASLWLAYFSASSARFSSPAFLFTVITVVEIYVGDVILYLTHGLPNPLLISLGMLALSAGAFLTGSRWRSKPFPIPLPMRTPTLAVSLSLLLGVTVLVVVVLFRLGAGDILGLNFAVTRDAVVAAAPTFSLTVVQWAPMLAMALLLAQACAKGSQRMLVVAFAGSVLCSLLWSRLGARYPVLYLAIGWIIVITQFRPHWRRVYVVIGVISTLLVVALFTYVGSQKSAAFANISNPVALAWAVVYSRVFYEQSHVVATLMSIIPSNYPYFGGSTLAGELFRLPLSSGPAPFSLANWVFPLLNPDIAGNRATGGAPPTVFGEFYANFGPALAVGLMIPFGAVLGLIDRWMRPLAAVSVRRLAVYALVAIICSVPTSSIYETLRSVEYIVTLGILTLGVVWIVEAGHAHRSRGSP